MSAYDFSGLSPSDFESLCQDLLSSHLGLKLQAFTTGRDKGIDLRYAPTSGHDCVVQCKHFARSGYAKLRSHIANKELPKIKKLKPSRYVLATSIGLSPGNVDDLFDLLSPFCVSKHDIIGADNLNALIRNYPNIEKAHFKLWLTSEAVLSRVLHNDVFVQSMLTKDEIRRKLGLYVSTGSFNSARSKLESERVCILSGVPGVGKTTLAEMLLVDYLSHDWEVIAIHQNVSEGQRLFRQDKDAKQVFYYDDFLGQISSGEKLGKNEDRALLQLIQSVARTANKRFILTTREYILAQAKIEHEQLARSNIDLHQYVVSCADYSDLDKAKILANHLYFANVPQEHIAALVAERTYHSIIHHRNYNPRIIEWMTQVTETAHCTPKKYPKIFLERLENPSDLWKHAFENQLSDASRQLLLVLGSCGDGITISDLQEAFNSFYFGRGKLYGFQTSPSSFRKSLGELEGNFVRIERTASQDIVSCHNPSILDFLNRRYSENLEEANDILRFAVYFEQVQRLFQVFDVGRKRKSLNDMGVLDHQAIQAAIDRTLDSGTTRFVQEGSKRGSWYRSHFGIWDRLRLCCQIGSMVENRPLRDSIQRHLDEHLRLDSEHFGHFADILPLCEHAEKSKWISRTLINRWNQLLWVLMSETTNQFEESLEGLSVVVQWFVNHRDRFEEQESVVFEEKLAKAVSHEVEHNSDSSDPERLGGDAAIVEQIAKTLKREFADELKWINEALSECGSSDGEDGENWSSYKAGSNTATIESLFDSLIE
jgi:hypothetical protein